MSNDKTTDAARKLAAESAAAAFVNGDLVCHRAAFLKSCSWYTNVPINGKVVGADERGYPIVNWCNEPESKQPVEERAGINPANIIHYNRRHLDHG